MPPIANENILEQFLEMLLVERGCANQTLQAYQRDLQDYHLFLHSQQTDFMRVTYEILLEFDRDLRMRGVQSATIARKYSAIRQLHKFMVSEEWRADNPTKLLHMPKKTRRLPKTLSESQMQKLFDAIDRFKQQNPAEATRLSCLLEILYGSGLRVSELVSLPISAILTDVKLIRLTGKGGKDRVVPLSNTSMQALQQWYAIRAQFLPKNKLSMMHDKGYLFPSNSKAGHMTRQRFGQILKELAMLADIPVTSISPHVIRHAFASHLLNNGARLLTVQKMLGHADITTTQIYTHILDDELKDFVFEQHPVQQMNIASK